MLHQITAESGSADHIDNLSTSKNHKIDFAIFSAMSEEILYCKKYLTEYFSEQITVKGFKFLIYNYKNRRILLTETGLGLTFAASVLTFVYQYFSPDYIFLVGTAGGLRSELNLGDVVIAEHAFEAEMQNLITQVAGTPFETCLKHPLKNEHFPSIYNADNTLIEIAKNTNFKEIKTHLGTMVSSNAFPAPLQLYEKIKLLNPYSIDMETSAFYQVSWLLNIPVLAVKGISNILDSDGTDKNLHQSDINDSTTAAAKVLLTIMDALILKVDLEKPYEISPL